MGFLRRFLAYCIFLFISTTLLTGLRWVDEVLVQQLPPTLQERGGRNLFLPLPTLSFSQSLSRPQSAEQLSDVHMHLRVDFPGSVSKQLAAVSWPESLGIL